MGRVSPPISVALVLVVLAAGLLVSSPAEGQVTTGSITGITSDETAAVLLGVTVTARNVETNIGRTVVTDDHGRYRLPNLPVGTYQVRAELSGFRSAVRDGISLTVGQEAVVGLTLGVGDVSENVLVNADAPLVETTTSGITGLVDSKRVLELPLNGRGFMQLATLQPGVSRFYAGSQSQSTGMGLQISVAGTRPTQNSALLDGTDINDASNSSPGSALGVSLGVEAIREFRVLTSSYSAEYGRASGGIISAVTRSGTNAWHGTGFGFFRSDKFDARNFFDRTSKPSFKRPQFGFSLAGPLVRDRTFFFTTFEGVRQRLGRTQRANVPDENARRGLLPGATGGLVEVGVSPIVKPYLDLFPVANGRNFGGGVAEYVSTSTRVTDEDYFMFRVDHNFSAQNSILGRLVLDDAQDADPNAIQLFSLQRPTRYQYYLVEDTHVFSPRVLNTLRFSYNRSASSQDYDPIRDTEAKLNFGGAAKLGDTVITGCCTASGAGGLIRSFSLGTFQLTDNVTMSRGAHALKAGFSYSRFLNDQDNSFYWNGQLRFQSLQNFLQARSQNISIARPGSDVTRAWRQSLFGLFVQDDWSLSRAVTLNVGARYEAITAPTELNGKCANWVDTTSDRDVHVGCPFYENPSLKNIAPRVGFAWDIAGAGRTVLRGGFGIFHEQLLSNAFLIAGVRNPPYYANVTIPTPSIPDVFSRGVPGLALVEGEGVQYHPDQPYTQQFNVGVQRAMGSTMRVNVSYIGSRGHNLLGMVDNINTAAYQILPDGRYYFPPNSPRLNPSLPAIRQRLTAGRSSYNALQAGMSKRFSRGYQVEVNYTYGRLIDTNSLTVSFGTESSNAVAIQNPHDWEAEEGPSNFHVGQTLVANFAWELPFGPGRQFASGASGIGAALVQGWQVGGILNLMTGNPFTVELGFDNARMLSLRDGGAGQRPDLASGYSSNPVDPRNPSRYFDPNAFTLPAPGTFGNLARNTLVGPGVATFDFSVVKRFPFGHDRRLEVRAETFNALNRANFAIPDTKTLFVATTRARIPTSGVINSTTTTARQVQLALRLVF